MKERVKVKLLPDSPVDVDGFGGHERVATAIAELVLSEDGGKSIALEGAWGSGKSSVVRMLERKFSEVSPQNTQLLNFDAWSHVGDPLRRVFLEEITELCTANSDEVTKEKWSKRMKQEVTGRTIERDQKTTPVLKSKWPILVLAFASLYPVANIALSALLRQESIEWPILLLITACAVIAIAPAVWLFWLFRRCRHETDQELENAGRLISLWSKRIDETTNTTAHEAVGPTSIEFQKYFSNLVKEYLGESERRLIIVLDNLDRVPEPTARTLWATLRLFADCCDNDESWSKRVWFIVPYDREAAAALWDHDNSLFFGKDARIASQPTKQPAEIEDHNTSDRRSPSSPSISAAFLDKSFQVRFVVPPLHVSDWEGYLIRLIDQAMPGFGSVEERHRVYRLSERLADEKGRPPSPRHLKLYVNDIGAIVRQFGSKFPIDHLALYTILRRQCRDIRLWITSGSFKEDPLVQVMLGDEFVSTLLCIYFGTGDKRRASTLTIGGPLRQYLRNGEGEAISQLAHVPGFWNVSETELEKRLASDELQQEVTIQIASALENSNLLEIAPPSYVHVIPAYAGKALESTTWETLSEQAASAAEILLRIANCANASATIFSRLVSGEPEASSVASDSDTWAKGALRLLKVANSLGHDVQISIPGDASQSVKCLASLRVAGIQPAALAELKFECAAEDIQSEVVPQIESVWEDYKWSALKCLHSIRSLKIDWSAIQEALSDRLKADDIKVPEVKNLHAALFDVFERMPETKKQVSAEIVSDPNFYVHYESWASDAGAVASQVALQVLGGSISRAPTPNEAGGHAAIQALLADPEDSDSVVTEYIELVICRPGLALLGQSIAQRSDLSLFFDEVLMLLAEREDIAVALPLKLYLEHFDAIVETISAKTSTLTANLLKSEAFNASLVNCEISTDHIAAHSELVKAGALGQSEYRTKLFEFLDATEIETWCEVICNLNSSYDLLVLACRNGWRSSPQLSDAVEELGHQLCNEDPCETVWSNKPREWDVVYDTIESDRRGTAARKVVDSFKHRVPDDVLPLVGLFRNDLATAFAEASDDSLVRKIAEPIAKSGNQKLLDWLSAVVRHGQMFWTAAPDDDKGTFTRTLWQRVNSETFEEDTDALKRIAEHLNLQEPELEGTSADGVDNIGDGKENE